MSEDVRRRDFLKKGLLLSGGVAAAGSFEEQALLAAVRESAPAPPPRPGAPRDLPKGKLGKLTISRMICGGNLTSGHAHSRDLIYVSNLLKNYFTDEKILETWALCEENGIDTSILRLDSTVIRLVNRYWNERGGKTQWIAQVNPKVDDLTSDFQRAIDNGAVGAYVQGQVADSFVAGGHVELLGKAVEFVKENGLVAGIGGHALATIAACEKAGLDPDFYMKTINSGNYWSAGPEERHDSVWAETPEKTVAFMNGVEKPWIGFKVLGAGAIHPTDGFRYAFESGADFICVGMFDFQVREDAIIARKTLAENLERKRPWRA